MSNYINVLDGNKYLALATICEDGSPWCVPVKYGVLGDKIYWRSSEATVHSKNIERDSRVSISICDAVVRPEADELQAVYVQSYATKVDESRQAEILRQIGGRFSQRDDTMPLYEAPIGRDDYDRSTDSRFYMVYSGVSA